MAVPGTDNSPTDADLGPAWIEKGTVMNVDLNNWTVDVVSEYTGKQVPDIQVMHPYFHTHNGEGFYAMPEVGAVVQLCFPSDNDPPFILGYVGAPEIEHAKQDNLEDRAGEPGVETEEDLTKPTTNVSTGDHQQKTAGASFRGGRSLLNPGDMMLKTRDDNFIILRRGGVIQIGATPTCQSVWIPVLNVFKQFAENIEHSTPGGILRWNVQRVEGDPGGQANCLWRLALRDKAQNDKADVQVKMGHVSDSVRYQIDVAPKNVTVADGKVSSPKFTMTVDKDGNQNFKISGKLTKTIDGGRDITIKGEDKLTLVGNRTEQITGNTTQTVIGNRTVSAVVCKEVYTGVRSIDATLHTLGPAPVEPAVVGTTLVAWLSAHFHPAPASPPDPSLISQLDKILSRKLMIPK